MGNTIPLPFSSFSCSPFPLLSPAAKRLPKKLARGLGSSVISPSGVRGEAPTAYAFWYIFRSKIAPGGNIFYKYPKKKNSCIGKKYRNDVQKFTATKNLRRFRISWGGRISLRLYRNTGYKHALIQISLSVEQTADGCFDFDDFLTALIVEN